MIAVTRPRADRGTVAYAALALAVVIVATAERDVAHAYGVHALIGAVAMACGWIGRRVCQHRTHQVAATVALLLLEAIVSVHVIG